MLVLSRKPGEQVQIGQEFILTVQKVRGNLVVISIDAPTRVKIHRMEFQRFDEKASNPGTHHSTTNLADSRARIVELRMKT